MKLSFVRDFELEFRKAVLQLVVEKKDENTLIFLRTYVSPSHPLEDHSSGFVIKVISITIHSS